MLRREGSLGTSAKVVSRLVMPVRLSVEDGPHAGLDRKELLRRARVVFTALGLAGAELSVVLTGDVRIHALNRVYRGKDRPTDVLAFAMREGELGDVGREMLGDVIVSVETARRQAARAGHDVLAEVTMLLVHGTLHLLGWDHETAAKDRKMKQETARLVALATARAKVVRAPRAAKSYASKAVRVPSPGSPRSRRRG
jgi:probable rRNA maturation factor